MALVGVDKVSKALNITTRRVNQLVNEGMPREERGKYDLAQCMLWYIRYLQKAMERREIPNEDTVGASLRQSRQRLVNAQADREELELAAKRGSLIPVSVYEQELSAHIINARQRLLALPSSIAPQLEGENRSIIKTKLDAATRKVLSILSGDDK